MNPPTESNSQFALTALALATAVTGVASVIAVLVVRAIAMSVVTVPDAFTPLSKASSAVSLTIIGVLAAAGSCLVLNRVSDRPVALFRRVAPVVLVVSFVPDIGIWAAHAFHHTASASTVLPLMIMHVLVAALCLTVLPRLGAGRSVDPVVAT